ncbi:non-hydrolyzing UDP-N-acetylglucosamine 2-epimerase [Nitrosomonas sp. Nm166]|uniref:non-hydrolyzing UDP-N-acetylglucosamine 2-epimerase n=1 Tax=Nitrosomonas sp. Nm166 TaxID=1881054 RepID=UPI0008DF08C0|nr:UDP-N-acetylglucosamine 2-epimerase (non-hydrolyzing) [Nitrosomonas sp. Nm166]SFE53153.1 UDP-N-acetylglucosamine 2-epimerase (non-hydrolysing) [Nitrosomonas sp. Nm166]
MTIKSGSNRGTIKTILTLFGTRPEIIKLAPVIWAIERRRDIWRSVTVSSSQHTDLLRPFIREFGISIDHDLAVMTPGQTPNAVLARVIEAIEPLLLTERPDLVLVQGDTTTAIAGALAAFYARIPVAHVEAGLRTGNRYSPFPEEMNRRLITQLADLHFAATSNNVEILIAEGVQKNCIVLTGNPVVDALQHILARSTASPSLSKLLDSITNKRLIVLTTHRRENFGEVMSSHLKALRRFVERHQDIELVFPVHPNPSVRAVVDAEFTGAERVHCIEPLEYADFLHLLSRAWLVVSDSGGVQEEAPSLGKPLLVLRDTTERPEVLDCGIGRLVGHSGERLEEMLETALVDKTWLSIVSTTENPFGKGDAGEKIASAIEQFLTAGEGDIS